MFLNIVTACPWDNSQLACCACGNQSCQEGSPSAAQPTLLNLVQLRNRPMPSALCHQCYSMSASCGAAHNTTSVYTPRIGLCLAVLGRTSHFISVAVQTYAALEYPAAQLVLPLSIQTTSTVLPWRQALLALPQVCIHVHYIVHFSHLISCHLNVYHVPSLHALFCTATGVYTTTFISHALYLTSIPISLEMSHPYTPHVPALQPSASWEHIFNYLHCNMT